MILDNLPLSRNVIDCQAHELLTGLDMIFWQGAALGACAMSAAFIAVCFIVARVLPSEKSRAGYRGVRT